MKKLTSPTVLTVVATLVVALGAYWYFFTGTSNESPVSATGAPQNPAQAQFGTLVSTLQPISFDTSIFSDARFNALVDLSTPIAPESAGRPDPFAVLSGVSGK